MLKRFNKNRLLSDNIRLGVLTAFSAGMVNVASLLIFLAFTSNVTGHYANFAAELVKGNYYQALVVLGWIFLFFLGGFLANLSVITFTKNPYLAHALPLILEILCLLAVGIYGEYYYEETLAETELLVSLMLLAMGLQNGLTASISNFAVKTTHLTGATTDLGILTSMFTQKEFRQNPEIRSRAKLIISITSAYVVGALVGAASFMNIQFKTFYLVCLVLFIVIGYDLYRMQYLKLLKARFKTSFANT